MTKPPLRALALLAIAGLAVIALGAEKLPTDARIQTGTLDNGAVWMYRQHDNPPGKMALMVHVDTGSLNETEEQRGLAHFIEHMSFNGSENYPPGDLIPYFESIGMEFGADLNAFTGFDQTAYMIFLPDTTPEQADKALMVLSDFTYRLLLLDEEIDKERGVILSELRAGMSAQQRIRDQLFERLFAGTRIAERLPIGLEKVIRNAKQPTLRSYYQMWYRPERITLMMVGDAPKEAYLPAIEKWFGQYTAPTPAKPAKGPEFKPFTEQRAFILSDPEFARGDVDLYNVRPGRPPTTTVEQTRVELVEEVGSWIVGRRYSERIKKGEASFRSASAGAQSFMNDAVLVNASATGDPAKWEKILEEVVIEVTRAREHGFLEPEFALCKKELLAAAERAVQTEPTQNARGLLMRMNRAVNDEEPILSAAQRLEVLQRLLPTITLKEVEEAFAEHFKPGSFGYVLTMPEKEDAKLPSEEEVLAAAKAALARQTDPPVWEDRPTELLEKDPTPGKVVEMAMDQDLQIASAWLENGVRVHHRFMDYKKDSVLVSITLAGGQIEETADNAGITTIAALAIGQAATNRLRSTDMQDIMTGKNISVQAVPQDDTFMLTVAGSPTDLEVGLQLAHALLTDAKIEQSAFDNWKQAAEQQYEMMSKRPNFVTFDAFLKAITGDDPRRMVLMPPDVIKAQSIARSQAWLERLCQTAPIEVAVVGEIKLEKVMPLIAKYIGSLPKRERVATHLDGLRAFKRDAGPYERSLTVDTITPQGMAICGFLSCDAQQRSDLRALNIAASILDSRLIKRVREELGLVYSIGAQNAPEPAYRDSGFFFSGAPCAPDKGKALIAEIEAIFQAFADTGPTVEEMENARKQILNNLDTQLKEPSFWFGQLQHLDLHRLKIEDLKNIKESYETLEASTVQEVFRKYHKAERTFRIMAVPKKTEAPAEAAGAPTNPLVR